MATDTPPNPDDNPRGGRPPKLTLEVTADAAAMLLAGNFRSAVAKRLGIGERTFRRWMMLGRRHPEGIYGRFRRVVLEAEAEAECRAVATVTAAGRGDPKYLCWFLERKYPQRWGRYRGELGELKRLTADTARRLAELEALLKSLEQLNQPEGSDPVNPTG